MVKKTIAALICAIFGSASYANGWDRQIDLPGFIVLGEKYCTDKGKCTTSGDVTGEPDAVQVIKVSGNVKVKIGSVAYSAPASAVMVYYKDYQMPVETYTFCYPPKGSTSTYVGPPGSSPCEGLPDSPMKSQP